MAAVIGLEDQAVMDCRDAAAQGEVIEAVNFGTSKS